MGDGGKAPGPEGRGGIDAAPPELAIGELSQAEYHIISVLFVESSEGRGWINNHNWFRDVRAFLFEPSFVLGSPLERWA